MKRILVGDIGGTTSRLGVFEEDRILARRDFPSQDAQGLEDILELYLKELSIPRPVAACIAVAGVVRANRARVTNLPWEVDGEAIRKRTGFESFRLLNDFEATAWGVTAITGEYLEQIGGKNPHLEDQVRAVLGAGTGLGEAVIVPCPDGPKVLATEGGHADFAPRNPSEIRLLEFLLARIPHVSVEHVLSGPGLVRIHEFFVRGRAHTPAMTDPAEITRRALEGTDPTCIKTIEAFCKIYGAEAGNLALRTLALGGVYVAGGIAPKILPFLKRDGFREAFEAKGRMRSLLEEIPVFVVTHPEIGLIGAARAAPS